MPDRNKTIAKLRDYYNWHVHAGWQETELTDACRNAADLLEDDRERIRVLENTIKELNQQLEEVKHSGAVAKPRRSSRIRSESSGIDAGYGHGVREDASRD